jgi:hypothetical protein
MRLRRGNQLADSVKPLITSRLLPKLLAGYEEGDPLTVLDLGPGNGSTVEYLSRFRAKVFFADLLEHPVFKSSEDEPDPASLSAAINDQLALPPNLQIDICLLWDYLHYLDMPTIKILSSILRPKFHHNSRGYGFGTLHGKKPTDANQYGIAGPTQLSALPMSSEPVFIPHSQQRLSEHFVALHISRGTLLREGRLELLFETT